MDLLPSHEVEAPIPIRSSFVAGVGRGFGAGDGGGGGPSYPTNNHHHHVVHHLAGATAAASTGVVVTPTIPKEERPCDSPSPPQPAPPVLNANGPPSPPPPYSAAGDGNHSSSTHVAGICKGVAAATESSSYVYRECLRNHAASLGGNATDGCGEFMPGGDGASSGDALLCSACGCHRNFHRKEIAGGATRYGTGHGRDGGSYYHSQHVQYLTGRKVVGQKGVLVSTAAAACTALVPYRQPPQQHQHQHHPQPAPTAMALPLHAAVPAPESDQEMDQLANVGGGPAVLGSVYPTNAAAGPFTPGVVAMGMMPPGFGKKRFRTKFTPEQKKRMLGFAERVGWRLQRRDEAEVQRFCQEIGIKRRVLKVWMHNNKHNRRNLPYGGIFAPNIIITNSNGNGGSGGGHHDEDSVVPHEPRSHDHNGRDLNQGNHHHNGVAAASPPSHLNQGIHGAAVASPPSHLNQGNHHYSSVAAASPPAHPQPLQQQHHQHPAGSVIQVEE